VVSVSPLALALGLAESLIDGDELTEVDGLDEAEAESDIEGLLLSLMEGEADAEALSLILGLELGVFPAEGLELSEAEAEFDKDADSETEGELPSLIEGDAEADAELEALGEFEIDVDGLALAEADGEEDPVSKSGLKTTTGKLGWSALIASSAT